MMSIVRPALRLVVLLALLFLSLAMPAQGSAAGRLQQHMQHVLNDGDQWRTDNPGYTEESGGPRQFGLTFHLAPDGSHVTGRLTGIFPDKREVSYWYLLSFYNPVTDKVITQQIGQDGSILYGEVPVQTGPLQIIDMIRYGADGKLSILRHEMDYHAADAHASTAIERGDNGQWEKQRRWEWTRHPYDPGPQAPSDSADEGTEPTPLEAIAGFKVAGSGQWRAANPDFEPGTGADQYYGMNFRWGMHRQMIIGEIVSIDEASRSTKDWSLYLTFNPVTETAFLEQTGASGVYFRGEMHVADNGRHIQSGLIYFPNGTVKSVRDEIELVDATTFISRVFERDDEGGWKKAREWTWRQ